MVQAMLFLRFNLEIMSVKMDDQLQVSTILLPGKNIQF
jgi:hypothetical protein